MASQKESLSPLQLDGVENIVHTRLMHLPGGQIRNDLGCNFRRNRFGNLLRHVDIEFLKDLRAYTTRMILPEFSD